MDLATSTIIIACAAYALGGFSKGVLGVGLPLVAIPVVSTFAPTQDVVAVTFFTVVAANFYQAVSGGHFAIAVKRFWPMLLVIILAVPVGAFSLVRFSAGTVATLLGIAVAIFALASLVKPELRVPERLERPLSLVAGAIGGYFGGMVLISGPAVIMLLVALHLKKEEFIGTIGLVYLSTQISAGVALASLGVIRVEHIVPGLLTLIPVGVAMLLGQWVRGKIDQERFRKVLLVSMVLIGLNLIRRGFF